MTEAASVDIREAVAGDAQALLDFMARAAQQSDYISAADWAGYDAASLAHFLEQECERLGHLCLVATLGTRVIGLCHISRDQEPMLYHIGQVFLVVDRDFWGQGLAQVLLEVACDWADHTPDLAKLALTVQARNHAATHIYEKFGFAIEGKHPYGAQTREGDFLDTYSMGRLTDQAYDTR